MMTRREFIKVAGAGVLAVSCAGMLSGCDVVESLQDMDFVSVTIGEVKFMVGAPSYTLDGVKHRANFGTDLLIRNKTKHELTIPASDITGTYYCKIDGEEKTYEMEYDHGDLVAPVTASNQLPEEFGEFSLTTLDEVPAEAVSQKVEFSIKYGGYKAVFAYSYVDEDWILPPKKEAVTQ